MRASASYSSLLALCLGAGASGCVTGSIPDPKEAASIYAGAAARGDADAIYAMMTSSAQKERSRDDIKRIVADERAELAEQAGECASREAANPGLCASSARYAVDLGFLRTVRDQPRQRPARCADVTIGQAGNP